MQRTSTSRKRSTASAPFHSASLLSTSLQKQLNLYALAAGAGMSLLALAPPSEAEIVYTAADQIVDRYHSYSIDLNHDGIVDYKLVDYANAVSTFATFQELEMRAPQGNHVQCVSSDCISTFIYAAALRRGEQVKAAGVFGWCYGDTAPMAFEELVKRDKTTFYSWSWAGVNDRYLGLWFKINGENHYGWARLSVTFHPGLPKNRSWEAHLTGYAYETIADQTIKAGQMSDGSDEADAGQPASLGTLALGSNGLALWRQEK